MSAPLDEVLAFFGEWKPTLADMLASMERRFTAETVWENVGIARTTGFAEAKAFMDGFAQMYPIESGEVIVHHAAANGNVVLTERTDNFYDGDGQAARLDSADGRVRDGRAQDHRLARLFRYRQGLRMMFAGKKVWAELPVLPAGELVPLVQGWESAGLEGVWAPQIFGAPFTVLAAAAAVTSRIKLGTGIALAFTRSPLETACSAIDLDHISDGRAVLGLGSSAQSQVEGQLRHALRQTAGAHARGGGAGAQW